MGDARHSFAIPRAGDHTIEDVGDQATVGRYPCRHMQAFLAAHGMQQDDDEKR